MITEKEKLEIIKEHQNKMRSKGGKVAWSKLSDKEKAAKIKKMTSSPKRTHRLLKTTIIKV